MVLLRTAALAAALVLASCAGAPGARHLNLTPAAPAVLPTPPLGASSASQLTLAVTADRDFLVTTLNQAVPSTFSVTKPLKKDLPGKVGQFDSDITVTAKRGPLDLKFSGLRFTVSGKVTGTAHVDGTIKPVGIDVNDTVTFGIDAVISGSVSVGPDWKLVPADLKVSLDVEKADLPIGRYDFNVLGARVKGALLTVHEGNLVQKLVDQFEGQLGDLVAKAVAAQNLRPRVAPYWAQAANPVKLYGDPETWLTFVPSTVAATQTPSTDGDFHVTLGLDGHTSVWVGVKPASVDPGPLPDLGTVSSGGFRLRVPVSVDLNAVSKVIAPLLTAKPISAAGARIKIAAFTLYGNGTQLVAKVVFDASKTPGGVLDTSGTLYLVGALEVHDDKLVLTQFDFAPETKSSLVAAADWLAHPQLASAVAAQVNHTLASLGTKPLDDARKKVNAALTDLAVTEALHLTGSVTKVSLVEVVESGDAIVLNIEVNGTVSASVR